MVKNNFKKFCVISDLHIGAGETDDFDPKLEQSFISFLNFLAEKKEPIDLIINGDFFDFVQASPWRNSSFRSKTIGGVPLGCTESQSLDKLDSISKEHFLVFKALGQFLNNNANKNIVILPGNHDVDFFWPEVRNRFMELLPIKGNTTNNITFHLEPFYSPQEFSNVHIEHGHRYDPCNWFKVEDREYWSEKSPPIFEDKRGDKRLLECVGSRFLSKFLNSIDEEFPFVDNVKPFGKFIEIFGMSAVRPETGPFKAAIAVLSMLKFLLDSALNNRTDFLKINNPIDETIVQTLQSFFDRASNKELQHIMKILQDDGIDIFCPLSMFIKNTDNAKKCFSSISRNIDKLNAIIFKEQYLLSTGSSTGTLTLKDGFKIDENLLLKYEAKRLTERKNLKFVIMGHTHIPINDPKTQAYINTGSWTRYYKFKKRNIWD